MWMCARLALMQMRLGKDEEDEYLPNKSGTTDPDVEDGRNSRRYSLPEVMRHSSGQDCWIIVNDKVLNVTCYLSRHPGGQEAILTYGGQDASDEFNMIHRPDVIEKYAPDTVIGSVYPNPSTTDQAHNADGKTS